MAFVFLSKLSFSSVSKYLSLLLLMHLTCQQAEPCHSTVLLKYWATFNRCGILCHLYKSKVKSLLQDFTCFHEELLMRGWRCYEYIFLETGVLEVKFIFLTRQNPILAIILALNLFSSVSL